MFIIDYLRCEMFVWLNSYGVFEHTQYIGRSKIYFVRIYGEWNKPLSIWMVKSTLAGMSVHAFYVLLRIFSHWLE